jgi:hypothetical protein
VTTATCFFIWWKYRFYVRTRWHSVQNANMKNRSGTNVLPWGAVDTSGQCTIIRLGSWYRDVGIVVNTPDTGTARRVVNTLHTFKWEVPSSNPKRSTGSPGRFIRISSVTPGKCPHITSLKALPFPSTPFPIPYSRRFLPQALHTPHVFNKPHNNETNSWFSHVTHFAPQNS